LSKTIGQITREYFPDADSGAIEFIVWGKTGYPAFWNIGVDGNSPEECFRKQLTDFRDECRVYTTMLEVGEIQI